MVRRVKKDDYKNRQKVRQEASLYDDISIAEMLKICGNNKSACIEIDHGYGGDTYLSLVWYEPETDEEMNNRITRYEAELERWKKKEADKKAKLLEREKKEYLRLKEKFERVPKAS